MEENKTYVVYAEEMYFSMNSFSTVLKKKIYGVYPTPEQAESVRETVAEILNNTVTAAELNANNEMLTTFDLKVVELEGNYDLDAAREQVVDDDYTWGGRVRGR